MKNKSLIMTVLVCICLLVGCAENKAGSAQPNKNEAVTSGNTDVPVVSASNLQQDSPTQGSVVKAEKFKFDSETARAVLLKEKEIAERGETPDGIVYYQTEDMHFLNVSPGALLYTSFSPVFTSVATGFHNYDHEAFAQYANGEALAFGTIQEAESKIQETLNEMVYSQSMEYTCYTLTADAYNQTMALLKQENGIPAAEAQDEATLPEDCYYFYYRITYEGIAINDREHGDFAKGSVAAGSYLSVIYTKDGIDTLQSEGLIDFSKAVKEEGKPLISAEEALQKVQDKLDTIVGNGETKVTAGKVEYIAKSDSGDANALLLTPCWCFELLTERTLEKEGETSQHTEKTVLEIDALTGKEMIY